MHRVVGQRQAFARDRVEVLVGFVVFAFLHAPFELVGDRRVLGVDLGAQLGLFGPAGPVQGLDHRRQRFRLERQRGRGAGAARVLGVDPDDVVGVRLQRDRVEPEVGVEVRFVDRPVEWLRRVAEEGFAAGVVAAVRFAPERAREVLAVPIGSDFQLRPLSAEYSNQAMVRVPFGLIVDVTSTALGPGLTTGFIVTVGGGAKTVVKFGRFEIARGAGVLGHQAGVVGRVGGQPGQFDFDRFFPTRRRDGLGGAGSPLCTVEFFFAVAGRDRFEVGVPRAFQPDRGLLRRRASVRRPGIRRPR